MHRLLGTEKARGHLVAEFGARGQRPEARSLARDLVVEATARPANRAGSAASAQIEISSDDLVAQLCFAAPKALQIVAQDLDHIVFVMSGLTRRVGS